jgi:hypothetical protein
MLCMRTFPTYYVLTNISDDSTIIHNPVFERAIVKLQGGCKKGGRFKTVEYDDEEAVAAEGEPRNRAQMLLDEHRRKQARLLQSAGLVSFD